MSVTPRTRDNRIQRDELHSPSVGDEGFPMTCPRCGWPCLHVFPVYWDSPWNEHGGMCGQCAQEAVATFAVRGWPPPKDDEADVAPVLPGPRAVESAFEEEPRGPLHPRPEILPSPDVTPALPTGAEVREALGLPDDEEPDGAGEADEPDAAD